ncbi:hypothetical protein B0T11DRAFT_331176 [Plectosphaerella cucumerina]|nr:hypothetical protein B0T11DRAFT_331176 [Plectosphaerella cucumerina]
MVQYYSIAGAKVGSHHLALGVLGALFGGAYLGVSGGSSKAAPATPPIVASSSDEADFIKKFLENNEQEQKKEAKH